MAGDSDVTRFIRERGSGNVSGGEPQSAWRNPFPYHAGKGEPWNLDPA
jgi:hypothetical protein